VITISGSGDVHPGTFTATYIATVAPTGNCSLYSVFPCTFTIPATGRVIGVTVSGARRLRVGSVSEGIERLAVERAVEPVRGATRPR